MKPPMPKTNQQRWSSSSLPATPCLHITLTVGIAVLLCVTSACLAQPNTTATTFQTPATSSSSISNDVVEQTTMLDSAFVRTIFHAVRDFTFRWIVATANKQPSPKYLSPQPEQFPCDLRLGRSSTPPSSVHRLRPDRVYFVILLPLDLKSGILNKQFNRDHSKHFMVLVRKNNTARKSAAEMFFYPIFNGLPICKCIGDVRVIAALGDSLTAGSGAASTRYQDLFMENRGMAWSIGGQWTWRNATTLPNILKVFNPKLIGYSRNDAYPFHEDTQLNMAEIGAVSADLPYMTKALVQRIRADRRIDFKRDWKLVTICMGGNDICSFLCTMESPETLPERHRERLIRSLRYLRDNLPRTYVNVVPVPLVATVVQRMDKPTRCELLHHGECSCWVGRLYNQTEESTRRMHAIQLRMQAVEVEVAAMKEFQHLRRFAVVHQPFSRGLSLKTPKTDYDLTLLAYDCFHMSQKGHSWAGVSVWNNMLEPAGRKTTNWAPPEQRFLCPTAAAPFLYTYNNDGTEVNQGEGV